MAKIKTDLSNYGDAALSVKSSAIQAAMTDNIHFPNPIPPLAEVKVASDRFDVTLQNMVNGGKDTTLAKNKARADLLSLLARLAMYVQIESNGSEIALQSTAFDIITRRSAVGVLEKPLNFIVKAGDVPGSVKLGVKSIDGAKSYQFSFTQAPLTDDSSWTTLPSAKASITIDDLTRGQQYYYRAVGIGTDPTLVYSDVITNFVS